MTCDTGRMLVIGKIIQSGGRALLLAASAMLLGCLGRNVIGPGNAMVSNIQDQFTFSMIALDNVTANELHFWVNSGTIATIDITQAITDGRAILEITDTAGTVLYAQDIADDIDATTSVGASGLWEIDVTLSNVTGEFNFSIDRASE